MANCSVRKWDSNLIGEPTSNNMHTYFTTKMFTMGDDFTKKKIVYIAVTLNWDRNIKFHFDIQFRKDINSYYSNWNTITTWGTFPNYGLSTNTDSTTTNSGGATFIMPYANGMDDLARIYNSIQFKFIYNIDKQNDTGTGNLAINDITLLYRKLRDYTSAD